MHDPFCTLDLKLYSFLPGGQIYILLFLIFFFYNQPVLITLFGKRLPVGPKPRFRAAWKHANCATSQEQYWWHSVRNRLNSRNTNRTFYKSLEKEGKKNPQLPSEESSVSASLKKKPKPHLTAGDAVDSWQQLNCRFLVVCCQRVLSKQAKLRINSPPEEREAGRRAEESYLSVRPHAGSLKRRSAASG